MVENFLTTFEGESKRTRNHCGNSKEVIGLKLNILGKKVNFRIGVGRGRAKLADIVPLARSLCLKITDVVLKRTRSDGQYIPCCKGCSACCSRCLVPLSVPEALWLNEEILTKPRRQRASILQSCILGARLILSQKPPEPFTSQMAEAGRPKQVDLNLVSNWYASLNLACPFLYNDMCTIYEQRPLACMEHFVKDYASMCMGGQGMPEMLEMPVQVPNALGQLASELEGTSVEAVILPLVLAWYEENSQRGEQTWPCSMMVERFVEIIKVMASESSTALVV